MNYRLRRNGEDLGSFSLVELRSRRASGELDGTELVAGEGEGNWLTLDVVLSRAPRSVPPPLPFLVRCSGPCWIGLLILALGCVIAFSFAARWAYRRLKDSRGVVGTEGALFPGDRLQSRRAVEVASRPIFWPTNAATVIDAKRRSRDFRLRQYLERYRNITAWMQRGASKLVPLRKEGEQLIEAWIASNYGGETDTNLPSVEVLADRYANKPIDATDRWDSIVDPLALIAAGAVATDPAVQSGRYAKAIPWFRSPGIYSPGHTAYPQFFATVQLLENPAPTLKANEGDALKFFAAMLEDGGITSEDQYELGNILLDGWASGFFERSREGIYPLRNRGGEKLRWLSLVIEGEYHLKAAWAARGSGWADSVTEQGWRDFRQHMGRAREAFTAAWELNPTVPLPAARMVSVMLGDGSAEDMRLWFDRALVAQVDHFAAWHQMRWGLRPRWHGSEAALLALGKTALATGRFDTDVPRMLFDTVSDLENEANLPLGEHLYGRRDIWPLLERMYAGYIASPAQAEMRDGWRSTFAAVAHLAGHDDVAREQLEALQWRPRRQNLSDWGCDLSLLPEQVSAQTGPEASAVRRAEKAYQDGNLETAQEGFRRIAARLESDPRGRAFVESRLATIELEQLLQSGEWISLLPRQTNDPAWDVQLGTALNASPSGLEIQAGQWGHLLTSRVRIGGNFAVRGEVEIISTSNGSFQAGVTVGLPDPGSQQWYSFR